MHEVSIDTSFTELHAQQMSQMDIAAYLQTGIPRASKKMRLFCEMRPIPVASTIGCPRRVTYQFADYVEL
jgi:hypothetical protein